MADKNKKIAVVGAGIMGSGIAQLFAQAGFTVVIYDKDQDRLNFSFEKINNNITKWCKENGEKNDQVFLNTIIKADSIMAINDVAFVIEAVTEKLTIKQKIFSQIEEVVSDDTIIASNTSGISINNIASVCYNKDRIIGTHFFNPPVKMPLVEIINGTFTSIQTTEITKDIIHGIGKKSVIAADVPGFIVNRIITPMINQAILTCEQGIASKEDIDKAIKFGMGYPMGPLALADYIGLDTLLFFMESVYAETEDSAFKPTVSLKRLVDDNKLGVKTGIGFYNYKE